MNGRHGGERKICKYFTYSPAGEKAGEIHPDMLRADPAHRPITLSQAGVNVWPKLLGSEAVEIVSVHPYAAAPFGGNLDELILTSVRRLKRPRQGVRWSF